MAISHRFGLRIKKKQDPHTQTLVLFMASVLPNAGEGEGGFGS